MNRGVDGHDITASDADREVFVELLGEVSLRHGLRIEAYALMSNHFHLLARTDLCDDPSAAMQALQSSYASYFNRRVGRTGALFGARFWSDAVDDDDRFLRTARYIHRNPKDIVGLDSIESYPWSTLPDYLGLRDRPAWLDTHTLSALIRPNRYLDEVIRPVGDDLFALGPHPPSIRTTIDALDAAIERRVPPARAPLLRTVLAVELQIADVATLAARERVTPNAIRRRLRQWRTAGTCEGALAGARTSVLRDLLKAGPCSDSNALKAGGRQRVLHEAGDGHRPRPPGHRGDPAGDLGDRLEVDIARDAV